MIYILVADLQWTIPLGPHPEHNIIDTINKQHRIPLILSLGKKADAYSGVN